MWGVQAVICASAMLLDSTERDLVVDAFRGGARGVCCRGYSFSALPKCISKSRGTNLGQQPRIGVSPRTRDLHETLEDSAGRWDGSADTARTRCRTSGRGRYEEPGSCTQAQLARTHRTELHASDFRQIGHIEPRRAGSLRLYQRGRKCSFGSFWSDFREHGRTADLRTISPGCCR